MKNQIYIYVYTTTYGKGYRKISRLVQDDGEGKLVSKDIEEQKALKLMWEVVLAGGTREVEINYRNPHIVTVGAYLLLPV